MIRGLYSAAGGMQAMSLQQDASAHNLSHAMKPGFRREIMRFESVGEHDDIVGPATALNTDFTPGIHEYTGTNLDVAINGPGFFSIQGPNGPLYTRTGVFQLNGQGQIVTPDGLAVQGTSGPIAVPLTAEPVEILNDGTILADGIQIDQLRVTAFQNPGELERVGSSYFQAPPKIALSTISSEVRQGYRELGNTTLVQEMVQMISGVRLFDATQRALRQIGDTIGLNTRPH